MEFLSPEFVSAVGIPFAITCYLLWERAQVTQALIVAINNMRDIMVEVRALLSAHVEVKTDVKRD